MAEPTFDCPDIDSFCLLDRLGLRVTGQHVDTDHTLLACRVVEPDDVADRSCWCTRCGQLGVPRDTVVRRLSHVSGRVASDHAGGDGAPLPVPAPG